MRALLDSQKLLRASDHPLAPAYVRDQTPLKKGQITTAALRNEFRKDPRLPMMLGDENFVALVRKGVDEDAYVYKRAASCCWGRATPGRKSRSTRTRSSSRPRTRDSKVSGRGSRRWPPEPASGRGDFQGRSAVA